MWTLFFVVAGLLWVGLLYVSLISYGAGDADRRWPAWKVLLHGEKEFGERPYR